MGSRFEIFRRRPKTPRARPKIFRTHQKISKKFWMRPKIFGRAQNIFGGIKFFLKNFLCSQNFLARDQKILGPPLPPETMMTCARLRSGNGTAVSHHCSGGRGGAFDGIAPKPGTLFRGITSCYRPWAEIRNLRMIF